MTRFLSSLTNRIFLTSAVLTMLAIGISLFVVNALVTAQAERELRRGLAEASAWVEQYRTLLGTNLAQQARLLADLPKLKAVVGTDHAPTVQPIAADYRQQVMADVLIVLNARRQVLASDGRVPPGLERWLSDEAGRQTAPLLWAERDGLLQVTVVPIWIDPTAPEVLGWLAVGALLDARLVERIKTHTNTDIAFVAGGQVVASTLPASASRVLVQVRLGADPTAVVVDEETYVAEVRPLQGEDRDAPAAVVLRSRAEHARLLFSLQSALGGTAAMTLVLATLLSYLVARTITRPLAAITAAVRDMARTGDLTRRIEMPTGMRLLDEDARVLASTLDTMTRSIGRFQREAAQRERLSSLGRLSTVIAHEIRNPLMIIKTALRALRREETPADRMRQAASDIDEEVARLNRLVNEVLDFARPLRFEMAPARLGAICRGAATAAFVDADGIECHVLLDEEADDLVTDAERLRQALVNLLVNARQAVAATGPREPAPAPVAVGNVVAFPAEPSIVKGAAPVRLSTCALEDGRVRVVVSDMGSGIAPDDLAHIFEPYFTTRRTGTGLGLAITRNIIEGLGGTITIDSEPGQGTDIRIDLPRTPRPDTDTPAPSPS